MVTILADEGKNLTGLQLYHAFLNKGIEADYVPLNDVTVKPCIGCNGCTYKTYGKCVVRDDGDWLFGKILRSEALLVVSPILFGGYTVKTKRVIDKFGLIMDRHYFIAKGEMAKGGMPGRQFRYFALGLQDDGDQEEAEAFQRLVQETIKITRGTGAAYTTGPSLADELAQQIIRKVAGV